MAMSEKFLLVSVSIWLSFLVSEAVNFSGARCYVADNIRMGNSDKYWVWNHGGMKLEVGMPRKPWLVFVQHYKHVTTVAFAFEEARGKCRFLHRTKGRNLVFTKPTICQIHEDLQNGRGYVWLKYIAQKR